MGEVVNRPLRQGKTSVVDRPRGPRQLRRMDFNLTEDQRAIQDMARGFAASELAPHSARWDEEKFFPVEALRAAAALGLAGIYIAEDVGGSGLGRMEAQIVFEELSYGDVATAAFLSIHNMAGWMIDRFGSDELRRRFLPKMTTMELVASYCLTEPGAGSDAASLATRAERAGDQYVLNGSKAFISGGGVSDLYVVMARTGGPGPKGISAFVVEKGTPGLSFGAQEKKMGWNAQPTAQVNFDDCRIPEANRIGAEGDGFKFAMAGLDGGRINIASCSLGGARLALDTAKAYMETRKQFGQPLKDMQGLQWRIADMATELDAAQMMVRRAAFSLDNKLPEATKHCAMAKRFATDVGFEVANQALQLHGGYGYLKDYPLERIVRDLRVHQILEGANEIMRVIVARELFRQ
jgi:alkylation response protein AidB-like acyl-CoA dehydrogenase